jgi:hypothetical protein
LLTSVALGTKRIQDAQAEGSKAPSDFPYVGWMERHPKRRANASAEITPNQPRPRYIARPSHSGMVAENGGVVEPLQHLAARGSRREQVIHAAQAQQQHARECEHRQREHAPAVAASAMQENNAQDRENQRGGQVGQGADGVAESAN